MTSQTFAQKALADQKRITLDDVDFLLREYHSASVDAAVIEEMERVGA